LGPTEVPLDGTADVCITLEDFSSGFSGCELVFEFPGAVSPESVTTNSTFGLDSTDISGQTVTISVTDTDNAFSGTIDSLQIGCVTVRGAFEDTGTVTLESAQVDNEDGFQIGTVDFSGSCRELSVVTGAQCPTVDGTETTDPDGDGLCEDLNGNDRKDFDDVVDLFDNISDSDVTDNPEAFDFNGNDRVDFDDVVDLFDEVS
jgi:PKD repeat protein